MLFDPFWFRWMVIDSNLLLIDWVRTLTRGGMYWKIHSPRPKRFPKGGDFAPRGPRDCPRAKPEGNLEGRGVQNPRLREISRAEGGVFSNASRLEAVYGHSFIIIREVLIFWCDNRWRCYLSCFVWKRNLLICNYTLFTNIKCLFFAQYTAVIIIWEWGNWPLPILKGHSLSISRSIHIFTGNRWRCLQSVFHFQYWLKTI